MCRVWERTNTGRGKVPPMDELGDVFYIQSTHTLFEIKSKETLAEQIVNLIGESEGTASTRNAV